MKTKNPFTLRNFLRAHHGQIDRILLSRSLGVDSPTDHNSAEYKAWYNACNKNFKINMDLQHEAQDIDKDFQELSEFVDMNIYNWDLFTAQKDHRIDDETTWIKGETVLDVSLD